MTDICEVVITAPDAEWLAAFTRRLVEDRLVAGSHQIEQIRAIYRCDGQIHDHPESRVALHTRANLVDEVIRRTEAEHPYEVPCVLAVPITAALPAYAEWVARETRA